MKGETTVRRLTLLLGLILLATGLIASQPHPTIQYVFPLPDSKALSRQTTIILRFHPQYTDQIDQLGNLIQVSGSIQGSYEGDLFFSTDERTIIFKPDSYFRIDEEVTVTIQTSRFAEDDFIYSFFIESSSANEMTAPIPDPADFEMDDPDVTTSSSTDIRVINGVAVPDDFPQITTHVIGETAPGKIFYSTHFINNNGAYVIAVHNDGTPYLFRRFPEGTILADFVTLPDGNFSVFYNTNGWRQAILDPSMQIIDEYEGGHGYEVDEHEFVLLENGHALMTLQRTITVDMSQVVPGGHPRAQVEGNMFQEYDADKNVIFEWRSWDHLRLEDVAGISLTANHIDYVHMNSVSLDFDDHYIVSFRHMDEIMKINRNTGETIWLSLIHI